jgi:hypothetical protein
MQREVFPWPMNKGTWGKITRAREPTKSEFRKSSERWMGWMDSESVASDERNVIAECRAMARFGKFIRGLPTPGQPSLHVAFFNGAFGATISLHHIKQRAFVDVDKYSDNFMAWNITWPLALGLPLGLHLRFSSVSASKGTLGLLGYLLDIARSPK